MLLHISLREVCLGFYICSLLNSCAALTVGKCYMNETWRNMTHANNALENKLVITTEGRAW
jgi:hypothetical protein